MAAARAFCPRCGDPVDPDETLGRPDVDRAREADLCRDCYFDTLELVEVPDRLTVRLCTSCGAVYRDNGWVDTDDESEVDLAIDAVWDALRIHRAARQVAWEVEPEVRDPNTIAIETTVRAVVHDRPVEERHEVAVSIARETCPRCGKLAGNSYAGTVQIRGTDRVPDAHERDRALTIADEVVTASTESGDREAFVSEVIDRPEGVDIRVSTTKLGAKIADRVTAEFGGSYTTSETLVTEDGDGRGVYRVTYAVRLPRFRAGEIVDPGEDGPVLVRSGIERLTGRRLATGESVELPADDPDIERVGSAEDAVETTVVAVTDARAVQVLHPETQRTETIPRPADVTVDDETVHVVTTADGLYVVPEPERRREEPYAEQRG